MNKTASMILIALCAMPVSAAPTRVTFGNVPQPVKGSVTVTNSAATPLFVINTEDQNGFAAGCDQLADSSGNAQCLLGTIPAGKTLVITTITCAATVPVGFPMVGLILSGNGIPIGGGAATTVNHRLQLTHTATIPNSSDQYELTTPVRIYVAGPTTGASTGLYVYGNVGTSPALRTGMACTVSGYMVSQAP